MRALCVWMCVADCITLENAKERVVSVELAVDTRNMALEPLFSRVAGTLVMTAADAEFFSRVEFESSVHEVVGDKSKVEQLSISEGNTKKKTGGAPGMGATVCTFCGALAPGVNVILWHEEERSVLGLCVARAAGSPSVETVQAVRSALQGACGLCEHYEFDLLRPLGSVPLFGNQLEDNERLWAVWRAEPVGTFAATHTGFVVKLLRSTSAELALLREVQVGAQINCLHNSAVVGWGLRGD